MKCDNDDTYWQWLMKNKATLENEKRELEWVGKIYNSTTPKFKVGGPNNELIYYANST